MPDGRYRYSLTRRLGDGPTATFILLNPSTADATTDDPTVRKCAGFARRWGCGRLRIVNLFARRATSPRALMRLADPVGAGNRAAIAAALAAGAGGPVVAGWGNFGAFGAQAERVMAWLAGRGGVALWCLGVTRGGAPHHPLYVAYSTPLAPYPPLSSAAASLR
jgi:hypothetical protein